MIDDQFTLKYKKQLKFINCNLVNVELHPSSKTYLCNTSQIEYEIDENGEIENTTPLGKRNPSGIQDNEVDDILADDDIDNLFLWGDYQHRIKRARKERGKPEKPPKIKENNNNKSLITPLITEKVKKV